MSRILVAGCGFVGLEAAKRLHQLGWEVVGLTHSTESAERMKDEPFQIIACDINDRERLASLGSFDAILDAVSSGRGGADAYRRVYLEGAQSLLEVIRPKQFLFTSSTSVYPQADGSIVTEESAAEPERGTGQLLRATENAVLAAGGLVARLAGIYGPGRWILLEKFLEGRAVIEGDGSKVLNQIHRDDAAAAVVHLLTTDSQPGIYNVADNTPMTQLEAYTLFAEYFGHDLPPYGPIDLNRKRGWTSKHVSNAKMRGLGWNPKYPSMREALGRTTLREPQV